ncbi:MAG: hypothetical protein IKW83_08295 [Muribaculaceae bacterium]|nr:hypothetical protein [Muribaculaceae bacterium]
MKQILSIILFAGLVLGTISCKGSGASDSSDKSSTESSTAKRSTTALEDSLADNLGNMAGIDLKAGLQQNPDMEMQLDIDEFLKGMTSVIEMDTTKSSQSYIMGLQQGLRVYQEIAQLEAQGINVDRKRYLNEFKKVIDSKDSINFEKVQQEMQTKQIQVQDMKTRALKIRGEENLAAGKKYIDELMKKDNGYQKDASGVIYKIVNQGNGESFNDASVVDTKMLLKDINGNVLENMSKPQPLPLAQMKQHPLFAKLYDIVKGMKPGAKVLAVIPGDLIPTEQMGISPNTTLLIEITTEGLHKAESKSSPAQQTNSGQAQVQQPAKVQ